MHTSDSLMFLPTIGRITADAVSVDSIRKDNNHINNKR